MVMTVVVMSGAIVAPTNAAAQAGDLIKMDGLSAVYYLGDDGQRYVFPNESTYFSWYSDFSGVVTIPSSELQSYPIGGNITMRPGTNLVKITTDPTVYAVEPGGELRAIASEASAVELYGPEWAERVVDVADSFFVNYEVGEELAADTYPTGALVQPTGSVDVYYVDNGEYRPFASEAAFLANNFSWDDVIITDNEVTSLGSEISGYVPELFNPANAAVDGGDVPTGTGLSAALSSSTPAATTIPYNVQGQVYTSVNFTASNDGAVELTGLEIKRTGLGYTESFDKVYVEVDGERHGNKRTLGSDNTANLYFNTASSMITIPAGETVTVDIVADMDAGVDYRTGDNALSIVGASSVDASATVTGSFPITGNMMSVSGVAAPTAQLDLVDDAEDVYLGDEQVEVAEFSVDNTSDSEHISFTEITLENIGTADENEVINYTLYNDSDEVVAGPVDANSNDMIRFVLDDSVELEDNRDETFVVKADIYDGRAQTVELVLDETTDLKAVGLNNGFNVVISDDVHNDSSVYTINGGDLSFSEANSNPGSVDVAPLDEDVLFLAADVEALEEMMTITDVTLDLSTGSANASSLEAVTIYLDGDVVAGPSDFSTATSSTISFDEEFQVSGTQLLEVKADIADGAAAGTYRIDLDSTFVVAEDEEGDLVKNDGSEDDKIKGTVEGANITVDTGTLDLYVDATYGNRSLVAGDDLLVGQYIIEAGDAEGVKIDRYVVGFTDGTGTSIDDVDINELYISEDDDVVTSVSGDTSFNVNEELAAGENKVVKVYVSLDSDLDISSADVVATTLNVEGEGLVSGQPLELTAVDGQEMTLTTGELNADISAGTPDSDIVVAGTSDVNVAEWEFEAVNTSYELKDVKVTVYDGTTFDEGNIDKALVTSMTLNGETATVINGVATFDGPFEVAKDDDLKLSLQATFNGDFNSITSGDVANFAITEYSYRAANENSDTVEDSLDIDNYDTGELMYVRNTVPTITTSAGDTSTLKSSENEMMNVHVTADEADDVTIVDLGLNIYSDVGASGDNITINVLDSNGDTVGTATSSYDSYNAGTDVAVTLDEVIPADQTEVYTVSVTYDSSTPAEDEILRVKLVEDGFVWGDEEDDNINVSAEAGIIIPSTGVTYEITK